MNIFIIEDEPPILREIVCAVQNLGTSYHVLDTASNGQEAVEKLKQLGERIDIIVTDINLPVISGLEIIAFAKTHYPHVACVIVSGYSDFPYAQEAIRLGVVDYLLKPIETKEVKRVLNAAWETRCMHNIAPNVLHCKREHTSSVYFLAIVCVDTYFFEGNYRSSEDEQATDYYAQAFRHTLDRVLIEHNFWLIDGLFSREKFLMLSCDDLTIAEHLFKDVFLAMKGNKHTLTMVTHREGIVDGNINRACKSLRSRLKKAIVMEKSQLITTPSGKSIEPSRFHKDIKSLSDLFKNGLFSRFLSDLYALLLSFRACELPQHMVIKLVNAILSDCKSNIDGVSFDWQEQSALADDLFSYSFTYEHLYTNLRALLEYAFEIQSSGNTRDLLLLKIDNYIQAHYRENINTQDLCQNFNFTSAYISKLYKDYKGISPTAYITQLRMEEAKKLLKGNITVREVSQHLGYVDPFYFSRQFKRTYGLSPKQYQSAE